MSQQVTDEPALCACGRPWVECPPGHVRTFGTDGSYTCTELTPEPRTETP